MNKSRKLKPDKGFVPYPEKERDEFYPNGIFKFNISRMIEYINTNPEEFRQEEIIIQDYISAFSSLNEEHLPTVDTSKPVIIAEIAPERFNVIDGNHRLEKAKRSGQKAISAYRLTPEQHIKFLSSVKSYTAYIDYWNQKLKENQQRENKWGLK